MKNLVIYNRSSVIHGVFDYNGNLLSYLNSFTSLRIVPEKHYFHSNSSHAEELSAEPIILHPHNIMFVGVDE